MLFSAPTFSLYPMPMKNHTHSHTHDKSAAFEPAHPVRFAAARKSTWVSIFINLALTIMQVLAGFFGKSQSLMADGLHSLADLLSDVLVLFANRHGNRHADANHPYGHARIETATSLILGVSLAALGIGFLLAAGTNRRRSMHDPAGTARPRGATAVPFCCAHLHQ